MGTRAYGAYCIQRTRQEDAYGVGGSGDWTRRPFYSTTLGAERRLVTEPRLLGLGREPPKPDHGVIDVTGDLVVPVDQRHFGFWLSMLLGSPITTSIGGGSYGHVFRSGAETLPTLERELQHTQTLAYAHAKGVALRSMAFTWSRAGKPQATLDCIGQSETTTATAATGTEASVAYDAFTAFMGSVKSAGAALGNVVGARLTYSNGSEAVENIRPDGLIDGVDPGAVTVSGELILRFDGLGLFTAASDGTPIDLELGYIATGGASLLLALHEVYLPRPKLPVEGPRGIQARYDFQAALNETEGASLTATLTNDVASY